MAVGALVVDDEEDIRLLIRMLIEVADSELFVAGEAATGEEALACFDELRPDVVILDEMMPGLSGLEVARRLRADHPDLPMLLCSAFVDGVVRNQAEDAGITAVLTKQDLERLPEVLRTFAA